MDLFKIKKTKNHKKNLKFWLQSIDDAKYPLKMKTQFVSLMKIKTQRGHEFRKKKKFLCTKTFQSIKPQIDFNSKNVGDVKTTCEPVRNPMWRKNFQKIRKRTQIIYIMNSFGGWNYIFVIAQIIRNSFVVNYFHCMLLFPSYFSRAGLIWLSGMSVWQVWIPFELRTASKFI